MSERTKEMDRWEGPVTLESTGYHKKLYNILRWVAKAASKDETRFFMSGMYNEVQGDRQVFVCTDGRHIHMVSIPMCRVSLSDIPAGKSLAFTLNSKGITFTQEIEGDFSNYKRVIPDISNVAPLIIILDKRTGNTEALYDLYKCRIKVNALHVAALDGTNDDLWKAYRVGNLLMFKSETIWAEYTSVCALWDE